MTKSNYELCKEELSKITYPKELLLHSCCAPCSSHVITYLSKYFNITVLYYNPNIYPEEEYLKRKEEQIKLINNLKSPNKITYLDCEYENDLYESKIKGYETCQERGPRCTICYNLRLEKTAMLAEKYNFDYFCTTLTVSPYKNATLINELGFALAKKYNIKWLPSDFKKEDGYKKSIELSKKYNLYRQNYCGCIYSKRIEEEKKEKDL